LIEALRDRDSSVRGAATTALLRIEPDFRSDLIDVNK
jgi:hypothetical protein